MDIVIRAAGQQDLDRIAYIENACFPLAEAASRASLRERLQAFKHTFLVAEHDGAVIGFCNGCVTNGRKLCDELYESTQRHDDTAANVMIFGLDVHPAYQHQGVAASLMKAFIANARVRDKALINLTCKERLIPFYEQFGYCCEGQSDSVHGGARWYDMTLLL